ncbi:hypothetical protein IFM89_030160 [Coptis chinensis]|uniref:Vacuolar iron transporter n=1 Tax=Coptis chinensis TaxID=261450 RepID=A0A835H0Q7_9MAGN|nr:hypothetical protein IFM89_030160 [Coptis chinensis]
MDDHNSTVLLIDSQDEEAQTKYNTSDKKPKETYIKGETIKSIVYADLNAIVTCFSPISSISAGHLSSIDVLVLGFANLVADGISMGFGDYMSSSTEKDMSAKERVLTHWEVSSHGESQELELVRRYQALGMELDDATIECFNASRQEHIRLARPLKSSLNIPKNHGGIKRLLSIGAEAKLEK